MRLSTFVAALLPVGAALAQGTVWTVKVGENGTLTYDPPSVNASVGDTIAFQFLAKNHTVTQSTFANPCQNFTNPDGSPGIDSGFKFVNASDTTSFPQWSFTLNNASAPLWFYCRQTGHCESGMVFAVNPTPQKTYAQFLANAMSTNSTNSTTSATNGTSSSSSASGGSSASGSGSGTTSPSASATGKPDNGAGAVRLGGAAIAMTAMGVVAGVLL
ncbi:hypothetical protein OBBRIDRAFT_734922 [Obba rivulosa]|uniref:Phytocyanin domain-containing protein n=1 Tax=Obba rivulosa TaxID=1052685 RepID=A0A8E2ARW1_9APHY|nr:hypothetical protein OBBRIDRAFT_734922 [Obba rivulosa]